MIITYSLSRVSCGSFLPGPAIRPGRLAPLLFLLWQLLTWHGDLLAQNTPLENPHALPTSFLPKSPTLAQPQPSDNLSNVDLVTGAAQATVPLTEIIAGTLRLPLTLGYSYSGMRVVQAPDLVGLGWSLQAGGSISRQVVGRLDDDPSGYGPYSSAVVQANQGNHDFLEAATQGNADPAPDIYTFSVAGYHGSFLVRDTAVVLLPQQPLRIRRFPRGFQLAAETGIRYVFEAVEFTHPNHENFGLLGQHASAWHLTQIISAGSTDTIRLYYSNWRYQEKPRIGQTSLRALLSVNGLLVNYLDQPPSNSYVKGSVIDTKVLDSICARGAHILIRRDAAHVVQQVCLINTLHGQRHAIRTIQLGHSSFRSTSSFPDDRRLRLDWVQEHTATEQLPPYRFAYDTTALPPTSSTAQDHWGYYNGVLSNGNSPTASALLPHPLLALSGLSPLRSPAMPYTGAGALQRITYPTGGATTLFYEPNRYPIVNNSHSVPVHLDPIASQESLHNLDGVALFNTQRSYKNFPCSSARFTLTTPTWVSFSFETKPLYPGSGYNNRTPDFLLVRRDTVLAEKSAQPGQPVSWRQLLPPGSYAVWLICEPETAQGYTHAEEFVIGSVVLPDAIVATPDVAGNGVRVWQTKTISAGAPPLTRSYSYLQNGEYGPYSSAVMLLPIDNDGNPIYHSTPLRTYTLGNLGGNGNTFIISDYYHFTSDITRFDDEYNSKYRFYYSRVTEQRTAAADSTNGKTVHFYTHWPEQFNEVLPSQLEIYQSTPGLDRGGYKLIQREQYHYAIDPQAPSFTALRPYVWATNEASALTPSHNLYRSDAYNVQAHFLAPDSTIITRYDNDRHPFTTTVATSYRQQRPVRSATRTSNGDYKIKTLAYLSDYTPTLPNFAQLRANNFNPIIEAQSWLRLAGRSDSLLTGGDITLYEPRWQQPANIWHLDLDHPVLGVNAQHIVNGLYQSWLSDSRYRWVSSEYYDPNTGDPIGQRVVAGSPTAYVWGYHRTQLIAQVQNATAAQVAYTGFEAGELGRWLGQPSAIAAPGYTGGAGYNLAAGLECHNLPPGRYQLQCRRLGVAGALIVNGQMLLPTGEAAQNWVTYSSTVSVDNGGRIRLTGSGQIDELRLYPVDARMSSYSYNPLVGMSSYTDASGRTSTYEYDTLGRLLRVRDERGHLLSQQEYKYARP